LFEKLTLAFFGALFVKLLDAWVQQRKSRHTEQEASLRVIDEHKDSLIKSADELVAKLLAEAKNDFITFRGVLVSRRTLENLDLANLAYLFCRFWAYGELLRDGAVKARVLKYDDQKAIEDIQAFVRALEARSNRILSRTQQRAMGEIVLENASIIPFVEFVKRYEQDIYVRRWIEPLLVYFTSLDDSRRKQKLLVYTAVVHAMLEYLDPTQALHKKRPFVVNKLTSKSRYLLKNIVFERYLTMVEKTYEYIKK